MERTALKLTTVKNALVFFEEKNELKRIKKGTKRYLLPPVQAIETDDEVVAVLAANEVKQEATLTAVRVNTDLMATNAATIGHQHGHLVATNTAHNINNLNLKNLKKSSCEKADQKKSNEKKHPFADSMDQMANEKIHIEEHKKLKEVETKRTPMPSSKKVGDMFWEAGHPGWDSFHGVNKNAEEATNGRSGDSDKPRRADMQMLEGALSQTRAMG
jgi:hypothetical protein